MTADEDDEVAAERVIDAVVAESEGDAEAKDKLRANGQQWVAWCRSAMPASPFPRSYCQLLDGRALRDPYNVGFMLQLQDGGEQTFHARRIVAQTTTPLGWLSTVFIGMNLAAGFGEEKEGTLRLYETLLFPNALASSPRRSWRYATRRAAEIGHERLVRATAWGSWEDLERLDIDPEEPAP